VKLTNRESLLLPPVRGLRFDRVALRLVATLQGALCDELPEKQTLLVTISAPIRSPAQTAAALEERIRVWLPGRVPPAEVGYEINGNLLRVRLVRGKAKHAPNVLGFVHNPEVDAKGLLDAAQVELRT
jgi:hypothetical protein